MEKDNLTVKEYLQNRAERDYPNDLENINTQWLTEILTESPTVLESDHDEHRWYISFQRVVEVEKDMFVSFTDYTITGDNGMSDMGLTYDLNEAKFVEAKQRVITETYYV